MRWVALCVLILSNILPMCSQYRISRNTHLKFKYCEFTISRNSLFICPIIWKCCTEHGSYTAVLCAKFKNDWATDNDVMDEWDFAIIELKMNFRGISYPTGNLTQWPFIADRWSSVHGPHITSHNWPWDQWGRLAQLSLCWELVLMKIQPFSDPLKCCWLENM